MKYEIDATNKKLGRVSSEIAVLLMGKNLTDFVRNKNPEVSVMVTNVSKLDISGKKAREKEYHRYSGYPGGLKRESLAVLVDRRGYGEIVRQAVKGMLPKNKLQDRMLKNLTITE